MIWCTYDERVRNDDTSRSSMGESSAGRERGIRVLIVELELPLGRTVAFESRDTSSPGVLILPEGTCTQSGCICSRDGRDKNEDEVRRQAKSASPDAFLRTLPFLSISRALDSAAQLVECGLI